MSNLSRIIGSQRREATYNNNIGVFTPTSVVNQNISNLDSNYASNNGLQIKYFTYNLSTNNYYSKYYNNNLRFIFDIFNSPELVFSNENIISETIVDIKTVLSKSSFNEIPVIFSKIETAGNITNFDTINRTYSNEIQKDTQGNYPSLLIPLLSSQTEVIVQNNLVESHITNKIPLYVNYGTLSPLVAYNKISLDNDTKIQNGSVIANNETSSYILNLGPCYLDELSAYLQFIRSLKMQELYPSNFQNFDLIYSSNNYASTSLSKAYVTKSNWLHNFDVYNHYEYIPDISNKTIFYLGIGDNYGWNHSLEYFKSSYKNVKVFDMYEYTITDNINYSELSYNEYINNYNANYQEFNLTLDSSDKRLLNPNVIMIKIPKFASLSEYQINRTGLSVKYSWQLLNKIIIDEAYDLDDIHVFIRSYGRQSDLETLKYLYSNQNYIPRTCGSYYDFFEDNFSNTLFSSQPTIFDNLLTIKPYDIANHNAIRSFLIRLKAMPGYLENLNKINEIYNNVDQIHFMELLSNINILALLLNNTQSQVGINSNLESNNVNYKIYSGDELFKLNNNSFNFTNLSVENGATSDGFRENSLIFSQLIGSAYINSSYWNNTNGQPCNRNTSYSIFKRNSYIISETNFNYKWINYYTHTLNQTLNSLSNLGSAIYFTSEPDLINALIFKINNDSVNYNLYFQLHLDNYNKNSIIELTGGEIIIAVHDSNVFPNIDTYLSASYQSIDSGNISRLAVKSITFGNYITETFEFCCENCTSLESITISKNMQKIGQVSFAGCSNLANITFEAQSSLHTIELASFRNCTSLVNLQLPNSIIYLYGDELNKETGGVFNGCSNLISCNLSELINLKEIGYGCFINTNLTYIGTGIPNSIEIVNDSAFTTTRMYYLFNSTINYENLTRIGNNAFESCINLQSLVIPNSLITLGSAAFRNCTNLESIQLSTGLNFIDQNTFASCISLKDLNLGNSNINLIKTAAFENCTSLQYIVIPENVTSIEERAFGLSTNLQNIVFEGSNISNVSQYAFGRISNTINIYYYSNLIPDISLILEDPTNTVFDLNTNLPGPLVINYFDLLDPSYTFDISVTILGNNLIVEKDSDFIDPGLSIVFVPPFGSDVIDDVEYIINNTSDLCMNNVGNYTINYDICYSNTSHSVTRNIQVVESNINKPLLNIIGNKTQNLFILEDDNYYEYGFTAYTYSGTDICDQVVIQNNHTNLMIGTFNIFYYVYDNSGNYAIDKRVITNHGINDLFSNLKINTDPSNTFYDNLNNTLTVTLENVGTFNEIGYLYTGNGDLSINDLSSAGLQINNYYGVLPLYLVTTISSESVNLSNLGGPPLNTSVNVNGVNYYFKNFPYNVITHSDVSVINHPSSINYNVLELQNFGYFYNPPLSSNSFLQLQIKFNVMPFSGTMAIFLDDGTSHINGGFNNYGFTLETNDTPTLYSDNIFVFDVSTNDSSPPIITLNDSSNISLLVYTPYVEHGYNVSDNYTSADNIDVVILGNVDISNIGTYTLTYRATDNAGLSSVTYRNIVIYDNVAPTLALDPSIIFVEASNTDYIDNSGQLIINDNYFSLEQLTIEISNNVIKNIVGNYDVIYTVTDPCANQSVISRIVNIVDTTPPTITLNGDANINLSQYNEYVELGATAYDIVDGSLSVTISGSIDISTVGIYNIVYSAIDNCGNDASLVRIVNVIEQGFPTIVLNNDSYNNVNIEGKIDSYIEYGANAYYNDPVSGLIDLSDQVVITGNVDISTIDTYVMNYSINYNGNVTDISRIINVVDTTPPQVELLREINLKDQSLPAIYLLGDTTINLNKYEQYSEFGALAYDNSKNNLLINITSNLDITTPGNYAITYTQPDNSLIATRTVNVYGTSYIYIEFVKLSVTVSSNNNTAVEIRDVEFKDSNGTNLIAATTSSLNDSTYWTGATNFGDYGVLEANQLLSLKLKYPYSIANINQNFTANYNLKYIHTENPDIEIIVKYGNDINNFILYQSNAPVQSIYSDITNTTTASNILNLINSSHFTNPTQLTGDILYKNQPYIEYGVNAYDLFDESLNITISGSVDTMIIGNYSVSYNVTDNYSNTSSIVRNVQVINTHNYLYFEFYKGQSDGQYIEIRNVEFNDSLSNQLINSEVSTFANTEYWTGDSSPPFDSENNVGLLYSAHSELKLKYPLMLTDLSGNYNVNYELAFAGGINIGNIIVKVKYGNDMNNVVIYEKNIYEHPNSSNVIYNESINNIYNSLIEINSNNNLQSGTYTINQINYNSNYVRKYYVNVPKNIVTNKGVIILLHGNGGHADRLLNDNQTNTYLNSISNEFIVVSPEGYENTWNVVAETSRLDDVKYIETIISNLNTFNNVNSYYILYGYSNGSAFSNRLLIESNSIYIKKAILIVSQLNTNQYNSSEDKFYIGTNNSVAPDTYNIEKTNLTSRSIFIFTGKTDTLIPATGGTSTIVNGSGGFIEFYSYNDSIYYYAKKYGYSGSILSINNDSFYSYVDYSGIINSSNLQLVSYIYDNMSHGISYNNPSETQDIYSKLLSFINNI